MLHRLGIHDDKDAQIVEQTDRAAYDEGKEKHPPGLRNAGGEHVELAEESCCERNSGEREKHYGKRGCDKRSLPEEPPIAVERSSFPSRAGEDSHRTEGTEDGHQIGGEVIGACRSAECSTGE